MVEHEQDDRPKHRGNESGHLAAGIPPERLPDEGREHGTGDAEHGSHDEAGHRFTRCPGARHQPCHEADKNGPNPVHHDERLFLLI